MSENIEADNSVTYVGSANGAQTAYVSKAEYFINSETVIDTLNSSPKNARQNKRSLNQKQNKESDW